MKTLKLQLLVASLFACGTAFAQTSATPPTAAGAQRGPAATTNNPAQTASTAAPQTAADRNNFGEDSYILQNGDNQYAQVDQRGYQNTADIYQGFSAGTGNNAAYQTQYNNNPNANTAGTPRNVAYILQDGQNSTAIQAQTGAGNRANILQGLGTTGNYAEQLQTGNNNSAYTSQTDQRTNAFSFTQQTGNNNQANVSQHQ